MPYKDPQKQKEYYEVYRRTDKGTASFRAGRRRYWEKLKADPVRLEQCRRKVRESGRLLRMDPEKREKYNAWQRQRYAHLPKNPKKDRKPMKPIVVTEKKVWARERQRSMFVENAKTIKRGRPRKKKTERPHCDHDQGFVFKMTEVGMRRTCNACKRSFTEVAKR